MNHQHLYLELTSACNLNCRYCFVKKTNREIPIKVIYEILNDFIGMGGKQITLSGGEPSLYSELDSVLEFISASDLNAAIITNGYMVHKSLLDKLMNSGIGICISLDGTTSQINDAYRGKGAFEHAINTLSYLQHYEKVAVSLTPTPKNINDLENVLQFCKQNNVSTFHLSLPEIRQKGEYIYKSFLLDDNNIQNLVHFVYKMLLTKEINFDVTDQGNFRRCILFQKVNLDNIVSELLGNTLKIQSDGEVFLSSLTDDPFFSIGNIYAKRFFDIYQNYDYNLSDSFSKSLRNRYLGKCVDCTYLDSCYGGIVYSRESLMHVDPYCHYRKEALFDYIREQVFLT